MTSWLQRLEDRSKWLTPCPRSSQMSNLYPRPHPNPGQLFSSVSMQSLQATTARLLSVLWGHSVGRRGCTAEPGHVYVTGDIAGLPAQQDNFGAHTSTSITATNNEVLGPHCCTSRTEIHLSGLHSVLWRWKCKPSNNVVHLYITYPYVDDSFVFLSLGLVGMGMRSPVHRAADCISEDGCKWSDGCDSNPWMHRPRSLEPDKPYNGVRIQTLLAESWLLLWTILYKYLDWEANQRLKVVPKG